MIREKRHAQIIEILHQDRLATVVDLSQRLNASYMTIWRDLEQLEKEGQLQRIRGGAVLSGTGSAVAPQMPSWDNSRADPLRDIKLKIGAYAAHELVDEGDFITIEAGTTASSMAAFLAKPNLTVLTNGLMACEMIFPSIRNVMLMCSGGILIETGAFTGPQAEDFFSQFRVKKAFVSAQGLTLQDGCTDPSPLYANLKNIMIRMAEKVILMQDSSKFGVRSLVQVLTLDKVNMVVTDSGAPAQLVEALRRRNIDVRIAEQPPAHPPGIYPAL